MSEQAYRSPGSGRRATGLSDPDAILGRVSASAKGLFTVEGALVAAFLLLLVLGIVHAVLRA
jgi:Flp pilus assembly protein TadG